MIGKRAGIAVTWTVTAAVLIVMLLTTDSTTRRVWLLTVLSWLAFPSSFLVAPVANRLAGALDFESIKLIDLNVSLWMAGAGYIQWFLLLPWLLRAIR